MANETERQSLVDEIIKLKTQLFCAPAQSMRIFDAQFNTLSSLMFRLAELDAFEKTITP